MQYHFGGVLVQFGTNTHGLYPAYFNSSHPYRRPHSQATSVLEARLNLKLMP